MHLSSTWNLLVCVLAIFQRIYAEERPRIHAAPTGFNAIDVGGGAVKDFIKIPGGYRDGFQKVIFEEVGPANVAPAPDLPSNDRFGAYDDNSVVPDNAEAPLFIPLPYRNETAEEKAERERKEQAEKQTRREKLRPTPPTTAPRQPAPASQQTIISNAAEFDRQQPPFRPAVSPPPPPRQPQINNQVLPQQTPFVAPQQPLPRVPARPIPQAPQPIPQAPRPVPQSPPSIPNESQTRPPTVVQTTNRPNTFVHPRRPFGGFTLQPPRRPFTFRPQPFNQPPRTTFIPTQTTQTPFGPQPVPQTPIQSFIPPVFRPTTSVVPPPVVQQNQFRVLRPFRPNIFVPSRQPSSTFAPTTTRPPNNLRTGVCSRVIYYLTQEATIFELQRPFSHFAVVVSVDQCARTCHEFNCAQAIFDPINRHCQFNPSTAFTNPQTCEQWPNPNYRNNVPITSRAITIRCITCQVRRRNSLRPFQRHNKALGISQVQFGPLSRSTLARRIHGVIISDNLSPNNTMDTDQILNKSLEAHRLVDFQPSIKNTNIEYLGPIKSSQTSSALDETTDTSPKNEDTAAEQKSKETEDEQRDPLRQNSAIIVHKLHPIHPISSVRI